MIKVGTILNDRYEVLGTIGSGGMSDVYKAKDNLLKRLVAIKVLKTEFSSDSSFVTKFRREAQAAGGLSHPNIVSVYDVGEQEDVHYIVMELVEGITLKKYIDKKGGMEEREAVEVAMQVARGIEAAHEQGIIHRDIKPQNIMISREGKVKVTDFGIARITSTQTISANTMGSVHYISPEQARGGYCDERSDIYSLGISLYEMVTGQVPFEGESSVAVALMHIQEPITPPSRIKPDISPNLEKIILKCTQKKPEYRYSSMAALLEDLHKLITTPDEDFVVLPAAAAAAASTGGTVIFGSEETEKLRTAALRGDRRDGNTASGRRTEGRSAVSAVSMISSARERNAQREAETAEAGGARMARQYESDMAEEVQARKSEKRLSYIMLGMAVVILVLIIALVFKACGLMKEEVTTAAGDTDYSFDVESAKAEQASREAEERAQASREAEASLEQSLEESEEAASRAAEEASRELESLEEESRIQESIDEESRAKENEVPDLFGKNYAEAREILEDLFFEVDYQVEHNSDYETYTVFDQSYPPGTVLPTGETVIIWIALEDDDAIIVPTSIVGMSVGDATNALRKAGFQVSDQTTYESSGSIKAGLVLSSDPQPGEISTVGTTVHLVLSSGPVQARIPAEIWGMTEEQAIAKLASLGFNTSQYVTVAEDPEFSSKYDVDTVMKVQTRVNGSTTTISAGTVVNFKTEIILTLSKGEGLSLPNLIGMSSSSALKKLEKLGFTDITTKNDKDSDLPKGQVSRVTNKKGKEIAPKTRLDEDKAIVLYISTGANATTEAPTTAAPTTEAPTTAAPTTEAPTTEAKPIMPNVIGDSKDLAYYKLEQEGFAVTESSEYSDSVEAGKVIRVVYKGKSKGPAAGEAVAKGTALTIVISLGKKIETVTVPNISAGSQVDLAVQAIQNAGLTVSWENGTASANPSKDTVLSISPASGTSVEKGSAVTISYQVYVEPTEPPTEPPTDPPTEPSSEDLPEDSSEEAGGEG